MSNKCTNQKVDKYFKQAGGVYTVRSQKCGVLVGLALPEGGEIFPKLEVNGVKRVLRTQFVSRILDVFRSDSIGIQLRYLRVSAFKLAWLLCGT